MLVLLDRDGVINEDSDDYIKSPEEWVPIPGSLEAIAQLNRAGHTVVVVTNQSGVGRGLFSLDTLFEMHAKFRRALKKVGGHVDAIYACTVHPDQGSVWRKPNPGMLEQAAADFKVDLRDCVFIGDSLSDIKAANAVECPCVCVKTGKGLRTLSSKDDVLAGVPFFDSLMDVIERGGINHGSKMDAI